MKFSGKNFQPWPDFELDINGLTVVIGPSNEGKCLAQGTPIVMFDGTIKNVEDVRVGDLLMGPDSKPRRVLSLAHGWDEMYDIIPKKGNPWRCNSRHILSLAVAPVRERKIHGKVIEITPAEFMRKTPWYRKLLRLYHSPAIEFPHSCATFNPYFVGYWLGDGNSDRELGLTDGGIKRIPYMYKTALKHERLLLLAGLLDSDGYLEGTKQFEFVSKIAGLAADVAFVARSLGFRASIKPAYKKCQTGVGGTYFRVRIAGNLTTIPTLITRKTAKANAHKNTTYTGFDIRPAGWGEYFGFQVGGDGLFLLEDFTVTHNSAIYRALRGVLRNKIDAAQIRNPKDEPLELTVEHAGHMIAATRSKKGSVKYRVDGKDYAKLDGDLPEIVKELKFGEIKLGDFTFDPIFAGQNKAQFLIDDESYKPSEINAILGAFGGTEKLEHGKKQANLLKTQKDGEARVLAAQIRDSEDRRARLDVMSSSGKVIANGLHALEGSIRTLEAESHWLNSTAHHCRRLQPLQELATALVPPEVTGIEQLQQIGIYAEQAAFAGQFVRWMNKPLKSLETATEGWNTILALWREIKALCDIVGLLADQIDTGELTALRSISATGLVELQTSIRYLESTVALRKELKETAGKLADIDGQLSAAQTELTKTQGTLQDAAVEAERRCVAELTSRGLCPKCGRATEHICQ